MRMPTKFIVLCVFAWLCACTQAQDTNAVDSSQAGHTDADMSKREVEMSAMEKEGTAEAAIRVTSSEGGEVVTTKASGPVSVVVRFRKADTSNPSSCLLSIVEEGRGGASVVAANDALLACPSASDAEQVNARVKLSVAENQVSVSSEGGTGPTEIEMQRFEDGVWYVTKASFTYSEEDEESGDMVVVTEAVAYPLASRKLKVSDYSYQSVKADLVKAEVK